MQSPICFIIDPDTLRRIGERSTGSQREQILDTNEKSERVRGQRDILGSMPSLQVQVPNKKQRFVIDGEHKWTGSRLARAEGDPPTDDEAVNKAYEIAGMTYDFLNSEYERNSLDNKYMILYLVVHYGMNFSNMLWNGTKVICGDGDGLIFQSFTRSIDAIAHELAHGITQTEANFETYGQPGTINEHFCDVFGSLIKQYVLKQTAYEADWLIGEGLFPERINGRGVRSMARPGTAYDDPLMGIDPQPGHMRDYANMDRDNGGVHINSGIPNHAFYITAREIGGYAWEKAGKIWYNTLKEQMQHNSSFYDLANSTFEIAGRLFGERSKEQRSVLKGWEAVGIKVEDTHREFIDRSSYKLK